MSKSTGNWGNRTASGGTVRPVSSPKAADQAEELSDALLAGVLVSTYQAKREARGQSDTVLLVSLQELREAVNRYTAPLPIDRLKKRVQDLLMNYKWLGLGWIESRNSVGPVGGIHWFAESEMYSRLVSSEYEGLAQKFAEVWESVHELVVSFRLLADAGSTTFRCLSHPKCDLAAKADQILTNNLFVAQWLHSPKVKLIEGSWDLGTGATVDIQRAGRHLGGKQNPNVAIMSWHYVKVEGDDVIFGTSAKKEQEMKEAAVEKTGRLVFMVVDQDKFRKKWPDGALRYSLKDDLLPLQNPDSERDIFLITDFEKMTKELSAVHTIFQTRKVMDKRVWLVSTCSDGTTWSGQS